MTATPVRARKASVVQDTEGDALDGASIEVRDCGTSDKISETIYDDAAGAGTLANPFTCDASGRFRFYLNQPQRVDLYITKDGHSPWTLEDVDVVRTDMIAESTMLVAANGYTPARAWVADGTADEEDIQAAIDALP